MAKIAMFDDEQRRWLRFDEDTELLIRYLDKAAGLELSKKADKISARTGMPHIECWNRLLAETCLLGWRKTDDHDHPGLTTPNGVPIPFTPENRDRLMKGCREISLFVSENAINAGVFLERDQEMEAREDGKNG